MIIFLPMEELNKPDVLLIANECVCAGIKHGKCIKQIGYNQDRVGIFALIYPC
jgi:hypothetical protein